MCVVVVRFLCVHVFELLFLAGEDLLLRLHRRDSWDGRHFVGLEEMLWDVGILVLLLMIIVGGRWIRELVVGRGRSRERWRRWLWIAVFVLIGRGKIFKRRRLRLLMARKWIEDARTVVVGRGERREVRIVR